jgi:hypothetical protein
MQELELVGAGVHASAAFLVRAWRRLWWALAPCVLAWTLVAARGLGWIPLALAVTLAASAALYREATPGRPGPMAMILARLAVVWGLTVCFAVVLGSLLLVLFLAAGYGVASAGHGFSSREIATWAPAVDSRGRFVLGLVGAGGLAAFAWALSRVSLGSAATVALGRVQLLSTWPLTRRIGASLLAARLCLLAPAMLAFALAGGAQQAGALKPVAGAAILFILAGLCVGGLWLPLNAGLMTYIYQRRGVRGSDFASLS